LIQPEVQSVIDQVPAWRSAREITVERQPGGLTNANYLLTVHGEATVHSEAGDRERFVLRIGGANTAELGIDRRTEREAALAVSEAGIAPEVILFALPEGHMITRFVEGHEWSVDEFKTPAVIRRVAETIKRVHTLPAISGVFSPYRDIEKRLQVAQERGVPLPDHMDRCLDKMYAIERQRASVPQVFCHNDPFPNNFLDAGRVLLLDWEFAGMGDPFYDLASACHFFAPEQKALLLECYFGEATADAIETLELMWFIVAFWNGAWALLQIGNPHSEFDYRRMVQNVFGRMVQRLD
jgi:thiamine kinase-like enzyme